MFIAGYLTPLVIIIYCNSKILYYVKKFSPDEISCKKSKKKINIEKKMTKIIVIYNG